MDPNVVDVLLIGCWDSANSLRGCQFEGNIIFLDFWQQCLDIFWCFFFSCDIRNKHTPSAGYDIPVSLTMLPLGPEGPSDPVTP